MMNGHPRSKTSKTSKTSAEIKKIGVPLRLYTGVIFLVIGFILYLVAK